MKIILKYWYIFIALLHCHAITARDKTGRCQASLPLPTRTGVKVNSLYVFESMVSGNIYECAKLCFRRSICKSANFLLNSGVCQLSATLLTNMTSVDDANSQHIDRDSIGKVSTYYLSYSKNVSFYDKLQLLHDTIT